MEKALAGKADAPSVALPRDRCCSRGRMAQKAQTVHTQGAENKPRVKQRFLGGEKGAGEEEGRRLGSCLLG